MWAQVVATSMNISCMPVFPSLLVTDGCGFDPASDRRAVRIENLYPGETLRAVNLRNTISSQMTGLLSLGAKFEVYSILFSSDAEARRRINLLLGGSLVLCTGLWFVVIRGIGSTKLVTITSAGYAFLMVDGLCWKPRGWEFESS